MMRNLLQRRYLFIFLLFLVTQVSGNRRKLVCLVMQAKVSPTKTSKQESSSGESSEEESEDEKVAPKKKVTCTFM